MYSADYKLILWKSFGKCCAHVNEKGIGCGNKVAGAEDNCVVTALDSKCVYCDRCFNLIGNSFIKLTNEVNLSTLGNDAFFAPTNLYLIHYSFLHSIFN